MSYATLLLAATCLASLVCADIHIRPGSLGGDGSQARPYATLGEGRDAARSILPETTGQVQLILHAGTHILSSTLELGPADSGRPGSPVVWRAAEGARPVISGGRPVGGWILSDPAKRIWTATVPQADVRQMWIDGVRVQRGRTYTALNWTKGPTGWSGTPLATWSRPTAVELVIRIEWKEMRAIVAGMDGTTALMPRNFWANIERHIGYEPRQVAWMENAPELLGPVHSWCFDPVDRRLSLVAAAGEDPNDREIIIPVLGRLLLASGVRHLELRDLTFSHSTSPLPDAGVAFCEVQAGTCLSGDLGNKDFGQTVPDWKLLESAIKFTQCEDLRLEGNTIRALGAGGLELGIGCKQVDVVGNRFEDISASGVVVGNQHSHHPTDADRVVDIDLSNNLFSNIANEYHGSVAILGFYVDGGRIRHNHIRATSYTGISWGWGWGGQDVPPSSCQNTLVEANLIEAACAVTTPCPPLRLSQWNAASFEHLIDGGAIYTLGAQPGSTIRRNYGVRSGWNQIYLDAGSNGFFVEENVLLDAWYSIAINTEAVNTLRRNWYRNPMSSGRSILDGNIQVPTGTPLPAAAQAVIDQAGLETIWRPRLLGSGTGVYFLSHPADATVTAGHRIAFQWDANLADGLQASWFLGNAQIEGASGRLCTLTPVAGDDAKTVYAVVSGTSLGTGSVTVGPTATRQALLRVLPAGTANPPAITAPIAGAVLRRPAGAESNRPIFRATGNYLTWSYRYSNDPEGQWRTYPISGLAAVVDLAVEPQAPLPRTTTMTMRVTDDAGVSASRTWAIDQPNTAPVALAAHFAPPTFIAYRGHPMQVAAAQGLRRFVTDDQGDPLTFRQSGTNPDLVVHADGSIVYTPPATSGPLATVTAGQYIANDGTADSVPNSIVITVMNGPGDLNRDGAVTAEDLQVILQHFGETVTVSTP
ncbi:hypothetical protein LBMAG53_24140 [Planctomycetota bacterium]|nr:hypothetical protein LBMAG53_24140 [Planctomycetota bacterium]